MRLKIGICVKAEEESYLRQRAGCCSEYLCDTLSKVVVAGVVVKSMVCIMHQCMRAWNSQVHEYGQSAAESK